MKSAWQHMKLAIGIIPDDILPKYKRSIAYSLLNGILDLFSLGLLIPLIIAFLSPQTLNNYSLFVSGKSMVGITNVEDFQYALLGFVISLFLVKNVMSMALSNYQNKSLFLIASSLSERTYEDYFEQSYLNFTRSNSAVANQKINKIPHDFVVYILASYSNLITEIIIAGCIVFVLMLNAPILLLLIGIVLIPVFLMWRLFEKKKIQKIEEDFRMDYEVNSKVLHKGIDSYTDILLHQSQSYFIEQYMNRKRKMNLSYSFLKSVQQWLPKLMEIALIISLGIIFTFAINFDLRNSLIPLLTLFIAAFYRLYPSIIKITNAFTSLSSYNYVINELAEIRPEKNASSYKIEFNDKIEFDQVEFAYPGKESLFKTPSLTIHKGDCIGIQGNSGAGKSTLIKLLMGFITPISGQIKVDNKTLQTSHKNHWITKFGFLQQQPIIIDGSIVENIAFADSNPDLEKVNHVIELSNLREFINSLSDGVDTLIGENGLLISGGQIQRIALARALYKEAEILIFDEISNNLDEFNINEIVRNIKQLHLLGKTIILIDHNLSILKLADKVWQFNGNKISEITDSNVQV